MPELDQTQLQAIESALNCTLGIITGGAGTGKTTLIKEMAQKLPGSQLCAFAGKAAARVREATGREAMTIHRMLKYDGSRFNCGTLAGSSVIIDEASMVPSELLAAVVRLRPDKIILVGDNAQLPPVGVGQPFHDLIALRPDIVSTLTTCYRNTEAVYQAASLVRSGEMPPMESESESERFEVRRYTTPEKCHDAVCDMVRDGYIDFQKDIILTPRNGSGEIPASVELLNRDIQEIVNPPQQIEDREYKIRIGDRVICTKNIPALDMWNGSTGTVQAIELSERGRQTIFVTSDLTGDYVEFEPGETKHLELAYALTVHKSQGSQYRRVIFCCLDRDSWSLLDRSLIYTAITRAKNECVIIGSINALRNGIKKINHRYTCMQELAK